MTRTLTDTPVATKAPLEGVAWTTYNDGKKGEQFALTVTDTSKFKKLRRKELSPSMTWSLDAKSCKAALVKDRLFRDPELPFAANSLGTAAHAVFETLMQLHGVERTKATAEAIVTRLLDDRKFSIEMLGDDLGGRVLALPSRDEQVHADRIAIGRNLVGLLGTLKPVDRTFDQALVLAKRDLHDDALVAAVAALGSERYQAAAAPEDREMWFVEVRRRAFGLWAIEDPSLVRVHATELPVGGWNFLKGEPYPMKATINGKPINCKIDRVDEIVDAEGNVIGYSVVDYKAGKFKKPGRFGDDYGDQIRLYADVVEAVSDLPVLNGFLYFVTYEKYRSIDVSAEARAITRKRFSDNYDRMDKLADDNLYPATASPLCGWCELVAMCPAAKLAGKVDESGRDNGVFKAFDPDRGVIPTLGETAGSPVDVAPTVAETALVITAPTLDRAPAASSQEAPAAPVETVTEPESPAETPAVAGVVEQQSAITVDVEPATEAPAVEEKPAAAKPSVPTTNRGGKARAAAEARAQRLRDAETTTPADESSDSIAEHRGTTDTQENPMTDTATIEAPAPEQAPAAPDAATGPIPTAPETVPLQDDKPWITLAGGQINPSSYAFGGAQKLVEMAVSELSFRNMAITGKTVKALAGTFASIVQAAQVSLVGAYDLGEGSSNRSRSALLTTLKTLPIPFNEPEATWDEWYTTVTNRVQTILAISTRLATAPRFAEKPYDTFCVPADN